MNNDLISRSDIKTYISELMLVYSGTELDNAILNAVDTAPTVEAYTSEQVKELVDLNKKLSEERPEGEWIKWNFKTFGAMGDWEYKCSNCEKVYGGQYNFCPNCGAQMKESAE